MQTVMRKVVLMPALCSQLWGSPLPSPSPLWSSQEYEALVRVDGCNPELWCDLAVCYVYLGMYEEARSAAAKGGLARADSTELPCKWYRLPLQLPKGGRRTGLHFTWHTR